MSAPRLAALALALVACGEPAGEVCMHDPPLTYESFGQGFMDQYCAGCHSSLHPAGHALRKNAPAGVDFDTYRGVLQWAERVAARSLGEDASMPPAGGPTAVELAKLDEWLRCEVADDLARLEADGWPE